MLTKLLQDIIIPPWVKIAVPLALLAGLSLWVMRIDSLRAHYKRQLAEVTQEYAIFRAKIIDKTATELTRQKEIAHASDIKHEQEMADQRTATANYIASHRVHAQRSDSSATAASADTGVAQEMSANIVMDSRDVQACGDLYTYAIDAYNLGQDLSSPASPASSSAP